MESGTRGIATAILGVMGCAILAYLPWIGSRPFVDTEDFRVHIAHRMAEDGSALVPRYYDRPILTKPPLHYWALGFVEGLTGSTQAGSARLVGLAATVLCAAALAAAAGACGGRRAAWLAGLIYLLCAYTVENGASAEIDPGFTALVVLALLAWWASLESRSPAWAAAAGVAAGGAFLAKGGAALPYFAGAAFATLRLGARPSAAQLTAVLLPAAALGGSWGLALGSLPEGALDGALQERSGFLTDWSGRSVLRTLLFPLALTFAALPASVPAFLRLRAAGRPFLDRFALLTVAGAFAILLLSANKSTRYLMPCVPLLALAAALRLELLAWSGAFARIVGWTALILAVTAVPFTVGSLEIAGSVALLALALAGVAALRLGASRPAWALALLLLPLRASFLHVYAPRVDATSAAEQEDAARLAAQAADASSAAVVSLETPRIIDPLGLHVRYFGLASEFREASRAEGPFELAIFGKEVESGALAGYRLVEELHVGGRALWIYRPD